MQSTREKQEAVQLTSWGSSRSVQTDDFVESVALSLSIVNLARSLERSSRYHYVRISFDRLSLLPRWFAKVNLQSVEAEDDLVERNTV